MRVSNGIASSLGSKDHLEERHEHVLSFALLEHRMTVGETTRPAPNCQLGADETQRLAEQRLADAVGNEHATMQALHVLSMIALQTKKLEQASHYWEIALSLATENRDKKSAVFYLRNLAFVAATKGNYVQADQCWQEALAMERDEGLWLYAV